MVDVNYGPEVISLAIPESRLAFELRPRTVAGVADPACEVRRAIGKPIGCPPLAELAEGISRVAIVVDDNTRPTPIRLLVPIVLGELNSAGLSDHQIELIIASGTHRPMTQAEIEEKIGPDVLSRVRVIGHNCLDPGALVDYGVTERGTRILINRRVSEADLRVMVGNIVPHHPTGWGGGAKMLLPGVAGRETTAQMHLLGSRDPRLGQVDTLCRQEMEEFAARVGPHFLVNTILNGDGEIVSVVAGDIVKAHRAGVQEAKGVWGSEFSDYADLTISSTYPVDFDLFQADKGIFSAELATAPAGEIILVSPCYEGISPAHAGLAGFSNLSDDAIWTMLERGEFDDPLVAAELLVFNHIERRNQVVLVSEGIDGDVCARLGEKGLRWVEPHSFRAYIESRAKGNPGMGIGIIHQSAEVLPIKSDA